MVKLTVLNKINVFLSETNRILKKFKDFNHDLLSINYLIDNCYRSYDILIAIECLLKDGKDINEIEHPVGILLRSGLYDFINFSCYTNKCISNNSFNVEKFNNEIDEFRKGHLNKLNWDSDLKEKYQDIIEIRENGKVKESKPLGILKEGVSISIEKKLQYLNDAIKSWEWYSKYEHYGLFTNLMLSDFEGNELRINFSIEMLFLNIYLSLLTISNIDFDAYSLEGIKKIEQIIFS